MVKTVEMAKFDSFTLKQANQTRKLSKEQAKEKTLQLLMKNPVLSASEIGIEIGRTRQTVYDYISELETEGRLNRNGTSISVVE